MNEKFSQFTAAASPIPGGYIMPFADSGVDNYQATLDDFLASIFDQGDNYTPAPTIFFESGSGVIIEDSNGSQVFMDGFGSCYVEGSFANGLGLESDGNIQLENPFGLINIDAVGNVSIISVANELDVNADGSVDFINVTSLTMNGASGVSGTFSPVSSITVVNGIVTAVS
jgi:hypothetical protein